MNEPASAARSSSALRAVARWAVAWWLFAAIEIALSAAVAESTLRSRLLAGGLRRDLIAFELCLLAAVIVAVGSLLTAFHAVLRGRARGLGAAVAAIGAGVPAVFWLASWAAFHGTGRFLDSTTVGFLAMSPWQFFQHVAHIEPVLLLAFPAAAIAIVLVVVWGGPKLVSLLGGGAVRGVVAATGTTLAACSYLVLSSAGPRSLPDETVVDPEAGFMYSHRDLYAFCREDRTGPLTHGWAELHRDRSGRDEPTHANERIPVERHRIVSLEDWARDVDTSGLRRWNVIIALVESLRKDQLMAFGGEREVMPNLEALASESVIFPDNYSQASHSNYADLCPLSSHYPLRSRRVHLYPKNPTYPRVLIYDVLKTLGWHTAVISSQNESWGKMINYLQTGNVDHFFHSETYDGPTYVPREDNGFADFLKGSKRSGKIDDRFTITEAIRWIDAIDDTEPFFIYLNLQNSHIPYETPADFPRRFGPKEVNFAIRFGGFPREETQTVKDLYADSLAYSDHQLGRLIDHLKATGEWNRTLLVVTGDTGQAFYEHGSVAHAGPIWDEVMRVPLLIRAPGIAAAVDRRPAQHIDVPPTVLDLLGLPPHPSFQGVSLHGPDLAPHRSRYLMVQTPIAQQFGIVRDQYKLIYDIRQGNVSLYNLKHDPREERSIARRKLELVNELLERLDTWRMHQLEYYHDPKFYRNTYPPIVVD